MGWEGEAPNVKLSSAGIIFSIFLSYILLQVNLDVPLTELRIGRKLVSVQSDLGFR